MSGLSSSGLVLNDNGGDALTITADGAFTFSTSLASNSNYAVTVSQQPIGQTCSVTNGTGTGITANVSDVSVSCAINTYSIGGNVSGLASGQQVVLNNGSDALTLTANSSFSFSIPVPFNGSYAVMVSSQPGGQFCSVSNASGTGLNTDVSNVSVACVDTFTIAGNVAGLASGAQVALTSNTDTITVAANGAFSFPTPILYNGSYKVQITTQPTGQTCTVTTSKYTGDGVTANVVNADVTCSVNTFAIGGTVSGLTSGQQVTLTNNGADPVTASADGTFVFGARVAYGGLYSVTVATQPSGETCTVSNGMGTDVTTDISDIGVTCAASAYTISGTVSGLASGQQVTLTNNSADSMTVTSDGAFTFSTPVAANGSYSVTVNTQPTQQTCNISSGTGTGVSSDITGVSVTCSDNTNTVSGTISGLASGQQVTLYDNGTDALVVNANGGFTFPAGIPYNGSYAVTVGNQPTGQTCDVSNGTGSGVTTNVTGVVVSCQNSNLWTWMSGSQGYNSPSVYGTQGVAATSNVPGARELSAAWSDTAGNLWMFGGDYYDTTNSVRDYQNDLWEYSPSSGEWTWVGGANTPNASGTYGTKGVASVGDIPGARQGAATWTDASGNFWLFGGYGYDSVGTLGYLNDLWEYSPSSGEWIWVSGSNAANAAASYGTEGVAASSNIPGARVGGLTAIDSSGNFWMFGGSSKPGLRNDLWEYTPGSGLWTWVSGSTGTGSTGSFGTKGVAAASNMPAARVDGSAWTDASGNLWIFGGYACTKGSPDASNDLWEFSPSSKLWVWEGGSNTAFASSVYGTEGVPATTNVPGGRLQQTSLPLAAGQFWLFGGNLNGADAADLWSYSPSSGLWTWASGSKSTNYGGSYGTQGVAASSNDPPARDSAVSWRTPSGKIWLFGGGLANAHQNLFNDLWSYQP